MTQKAIVAIVVVLAALFVGYLLFTGFQMPASAPEITMPPELESVPPEESATPEIRDIAVSSTEFTFNPSSIALTEGERVRVVFTNAGSAPHDFSIEGLGIKTRVIGAGQTDSVEFTVPASGNYTFFCSVAGHRQAGMEGSLSVE